MSTKSCLVRLIPAVWILAACNGGPGDPPPVINISGQWAGPISDATLGVGDIALGLVQQRESITGDVLIGVGFGGALYEGSVTGTISGKRVDLTVTGAELISQCSITISLTAELDDFSPTPGVDRLRGAYSGTEGCLGTVQGGQVTAYKAG